MCEHSKGGGKWVEGETMCEIGRRWVSGWETVRV